MSTPIQTNTNELMAVLQQVRALPDATDLTPIVEALIEKGQTVPDGADVNALAALIEAIEAGSVDFTPFSNIVWGTITPATDTKSIRYDALGLSSTSTNTPKFAYFGWMSGPMSNGKNQCCAYISGYNSGSAVVLGYNNYATQAITQSATGINFGSYPLCAGVTYRYLVEKAG